MKHEEISAAARLRLPDPCYIDVEGVRTCYHSAGDGPETIVLIYGGNVGMPEPGISAFEWRHNFVALSGRHRVVAIDKLGQGYTGVPLRDDDYTISAVTQHIIKTVEAIGLSPAHFVGHSRGAMPAVRIAMERPDLVRSLTIVASSTLAPGVGLTDVAMVAPPFPPGTRESTRWIGESCFFSPDSVSDDWIDASALVLEQSAYREGIRKMAGGLAMRRFVPELAKYKRETLAMIGEGRLQRPTQLVWGANDPTTVLERGMRLFDMIAAHERRATLNVFNQAGHFPFAEHATHFNAMLSSFVDLYRSPSGCQS